MNSKKVNTMLGADIITIGKAKALQRAFKRIFGVAPEMDIQDTFVRLYYPADKLKIAQRRFSDLVSKEPSDVRVNFLPITTPFLVKRYAPYAIALFIVGLVAGRSL